MRGEGEGIVSRLAWKIRPSETLRLDAIRVLDAKYVSLASGSKQRMLALMRVRLSDGQEDAKLDYASTIRVTLQQQRMKGLFDGLYRAAVPFLYVSMMTPSPTDDEGKELFEFDLVVGTWVDAKGKKFEEEIQTLEERASVLAATLTVALPNATVRRLSRNELRDFVKTLFLPSEPNLPQLGSASLVSTLESFDDRSPMVGKENTSPQFYVPNASESGKMGILLGSVKSAGGEYHDFRLQLEDLKRHVAILGMSVDHDEPIVYRRHGKICLDNIGTLVDPYFSEGKEGREFPSDLECVSFDPKKASISWSPIRYVLRHRYAGEMLRVGMETGRRITITPNHSVFALVKGLINKVDASELRLGDYLIAPTMIPAGRERSEVVNLLELLESEVGVFLYETPPEVFDRIAVPGAKTLRRERRLPVRYAPFLSHDEARGVIIGYRAHRRKLKSVIAVDEDLARLIGYYVAEGSIRIESGNKYEIHFTFGPGDEEIIRDCQRILWEKFGLSPKARPHSGKSTRLQFGHRILAVLLGSLAGRGAKNKQVPDVILNSPAPVRHAFIKAWIAGDSGVTVSRKLMNGIAYAFLLDGCLATVTHWKARENTVIEGRRVQSLPAYHLKFPDTGGYSSEKASLKRVNGREPAFPMAQLPNPLSGVCKGKMIRRRVSKEVLETIEARVKKLESYVDQEVMDAKHDGFYRSYAGGFLERVGTRLVARRELEAARLELENLKTIASSKLSFLKVTSIERVVPTSEYVYDVSVSENENFLAGFGGVFCHNTGSGKSTTAASVVRQVAEIGLPAMVLDWHNEYGGIIEKIGGQVVSPGKDDFAINPVGPSPSVDPTEHIAMVTDIFTDIYHFTHPQAYMFRNAMQKCVGESGDEEVPRLTSLVRTIEAYPLRSAYDNETKVALLRRLVPLTQGQAGKALNAPSTSSIDELLGKVICIELGHMRDGQTRSIFADILLKMIYEHRIQRRSELEHLTVVEEARNIAPARRPEDPPSVGERMISELRKFGEAMLFVAQFPTQVASEIIKNSGVRIIHRIAWPEDVALVGESLALGREQRDHITKLAVGEAIVSLSRIQKPILVQIRAGSVVSTENNDLSFTAEV